MLQKKKNLRLMKMLARPDEKKDEPDVRSVIGGLLVQERDEAELKEPERHVVSVETSHGGRDEGDAFRLAGGEAC